MDQLELLSNDELRIRLLEYGFPNLPVTQTTRKVLMKKLRNAVDGQKTKTRRETIAVAKFSSDEDVSDTGDDKRIKKQASRRATIAPVEKISSTSNGKPATPTKAVPRRASGRTTPLANEKPAMVTSTLITPMFNHIQEDTDEEIQEVIRKGKKAETPPKLGKSDMVRTSYKNADVVTVLDDDDNLPGFEDEEEDYEEYIPLPPVKITKITAMDGKKTVKEDYSRRQTLSTTTYNSSIPATKAFREPTAYRQSTGFGTPERTLTTSYNSGNYVSSRFQSNKENNDIDQDLNSSPYLSSFAKRLSTLQAVPLDSGMDKYRKMNDVNQPNPTSFRSSSSYYTQQTKPIARPQQKIEKSLVGSFVEVLEEFDRQYNAKTYLYGGLIFLVAIGIYVVLTH